jgi:hypothetical protein
MSGRRANPPSALSCSWKIEAGVFAVSGTSREDLLSALMPHLRQQSFEARYFSARRRRLTYAPTEYITDAVKGIVKINTPRHSLLLHLSGGPNNSAIA